MSRLPAPTDHSFAIPAASPGRIDIDVAEPSPLRSYLDVLRRRWRLIAGFAGAATLIMALVCVFAERRYTAKAVLHVTTQAPQVTNLQQVVAQPTYFEGVEYFQDQVKYLESKTVAAGVIKELGLDHEPLFTDHGNGPVVIGATLSALGSVWSGLRGLFGGNTPEPADTDEQRAYEVPSGLISKYRQWLEVKPIVNSRLVEVSFTSPSAALSQRVANAHVRGYIRQMLQSKFNLTGEARKFLEAEIERVQTELQYAEGALNDFRRRNHVVSLDEHDNAVVDRLNDLSRRLTDAEAARITAEADYRLVKNREYDSLPAVIANGLIQSLKQEVSRLEIREAELAAIFLPASPQLKELSSQLGQARARLKREIDRVVAGVESTYLAAAGKEEGLRLQLDGQQDSVLNLKELSGQYIKLEQAVNTARNLHGTLLTRLQETDVVKGVQLSNASIMDPADRPSGHSHPAVLFNLAFGLLFGTGIGVLLAFALDNVDVSLKSPDDVRNHLRLPTLGVVPDFARLPAPGDRTVSRLLPQLPALRAANGAAPTVVRAEAFRSIRTSVLFFNAERPPRLLLVTSSQPQEGKTSTTVNLALSLAQLAQAVIVVDADMRQPRCHRELGIAPAPGLSEVLRGTVGLSDAIQPYAVVNGRPARADTAAPEAPRLHLLQAGRPPTDPSALLASPRMDEVLRALGEAYDLVLIDSPPVFPITDSAILAPRVDGVLMVVRGHRTDRNVIREALERLRYMQANVMGVVLNGVDPGSSRYQQYAAYYFAA